MIILMLFCFYFQQGYLIWSEDICFHSDTTNRIMIDIGLCKKSGGTYVSLTSHVILGDLIMTTEEKGLTIWSLIALLSCESLFIPQAPQYNNSLKDRKPEYLILHASSLLIVYEFCASPPTSQLSLVGLLLTFHLENKSIPKG